MSFKLLQKPDFDWPLRLVGVVGLVGDLVGVEGWVTEGGVDSFLSSDSVDFAPDVSGWVKKREIGVKPGRRG